METQNDQSQQPGKKEKSMISGREMAGAVLIIVGGFLVAERAGADLPHWLFTWPMILIVVGFFIGAKDGFRDGGWLIPIAVGLVFLLSNNVEGLSFRELWPIIIIAVGLSMLFKAGKKKRCM